MSYIPWHVLDMIHMNMNIHIHNVIHIVYYTYPYPYRLGAKTVETVR